MKNNETVKEIGRNLKTQATILGGIVAVFWLLEIVDWLIFKGNLDKLGIRPRDLIGLRGILFGPFLHANFRHLIANTLPFIVLGWFVMMRDLRDFIAVTLITALISGFGIWLFGANQSIHIGASGIVFGYFGFLVLRGYFERSLSSILWAVFVVFLYGGMIWGILPQGTGISWQAHLFGFIGGGVSANLLTNQRNNITQRSPIEL